MFCNACLQSPNASANSLIRSVLDRNRLIAISIKGTKDSVRRSQWPRDLRRRSAATLLLRLWVRISVGTWMSVVSVVCCQAEVSATS